MALAKLTRKHTRVIEQVLRADDPALCQYTDSHGMDKWKVQPKELRPKRTEQVV